jgi:Na+/H+ antiporter NhaD/arsenite permease-like protein
LRMEAIFAVTVFVVVLVFIAAEVVNRTVAALLGAAVVVSFGVVEQHKAAAEFVDWNTIGLLAQAQGLSETEVRSLWWALALGADFGGNATLIGARANVVVAGMSERAGKKISFLRFMAYGIPVTVLSLTVATLYLLVRYYS